MPQSELKPYRRKAVACAASCAALAGLPAVTLTRGHSVLGFSCIAAQLFLLIMAVRFYSRSKAFANRA